MKKLFTLVALVLPVLSIAQQHTPAEIARYKQQAASVTIIRDNYGTPHIYSKTDAGVVFGLMYTQCEENFKGIERNYLYQLGRQSEADGATPLYTDVQLQLIADSADAIKDYNNSAPSFKKLLDAFADGLNYYLYKHPEVKPMVFKKFKPWFPLMFTDGSVAATETGDISPKKPRLFTAMLRIPSAQRIRPKALSTPTKSAKPALTALLFRHRVRQAGMPCCT
jgi:acyl-homoserine-lactone acylase